MTQLDDLNAALAQATTDTATLLADISAQVTALKAQLAALQGQTAPDLTAAIAAVNALDATVKGADPGAQPAPTPAPTPTA